MKALFALSFLSLCLHSWAGPIENAVKDIEAQYGAQCVQANRPIFSKCIGYPPTCFYNVKFKCLSDSHSFVLKVKVKEDYMGNIVVRKSVLKAL